MNVTFRSREEIIPRMGFKGGKILFLDLNLLVIFKKIFFSIMIGILYWHIIVSGIQCGDQTFV